MAQNDKRFDAYRKRDLRLLELGFESYAAYRQSVIWSEIRQRVLDRDGGMCTCCMVKPAKHVHHTSYGIETLTGESLDGLASLCAGCHFAIEFSRHGKTGLSESGHKLRRRRKRKVRKALWEQDSGYRVLKMRAARIKRDIPCGPERSKMLSDVRREMRAKEKLLKNELQQHSVAAHSH